MHRMLLNAPDGVEVDHVDENKLNNQKSNLRLATSSQNKFNKGKKGGEYTSKYKGVSWMGKKKKWTVGIWENKIHHHLGEYHEELLAAIAYDRGALKYHGEFAKTNFPLEELKILLTEHEHKLHEPRVKKVKYIGVSYCSRMKTAPYRARIAHEEKPICLGFFQTAEDAAIAYDDKARELGRTTLNFPE